MMRKYQGTIFFGCLLTLLASAQPEASMRVRVFDLDTGEGVQSDIFVMTTPAIRNIAMTDAKGVAVIGNYSCTLGDVVFAQPLNPAYFKKTQQTSCNAEPVELRARAKWRSVSIESKANEFVMNKDHGKAAQAFNELYAREARPDLARSALESAAEALGLPSSQALVFDGRQGRTVSSSALVERIKDFQKANGIVVDGVLGTSTLNKLAEGTVSKNIGDAIRATAKLSVRP